MWHPPRSTRHTTRALVKINTRVREATPVEARQSRTVSPKGRFTVPERVFLPQATPSEQPSAPVLECWFSTRKTTLLAGVSTARLNMGIPFPLRMASSESDSTIARFLFLRLTGKTPRLFDDRESYWCCSEHSYPLIAWRVASK
jgi:hypothetical protein